MCVLLFQKFKTKTQQPPEPPLQASVRGCVQQQQPHQTSGWADVEGIPVSHATPSDFTYVGVPIVGVPVDGTNEKGNCTSSSSAAAPEAEPLLTPPPRHRYIRESAGGARRAHGDVGVGVGNDLAGAAEHARASAKRDNEDFCEKKK